MPDDLIHTALERHATERPAAVAVVDRGVATTYGELWDRTLDLASGLASDVEPGLRVAYLARRDLETVVVHHALAVAGLVGVPMNPAAPQSERDALCEGLVDASIAAAFPACPRRLDPVTTSGSGLLESSRNPLMEHSVVFTSGTSGSPSGVLLSHGNTVAAASGAVSHLGLTPRDRWLGALPLFHVGGLAILWRMALVGGTVVFDGDGFDAATMVDAINAGAVSWISMVPTMLQRVLHHGVVPTTPVSVLVGGGPVAPSLVEEGAGQGLVVLPTYGMSETTSQAVTATDVRAWITTLAGQPLPGVTVEVLDDHGACSAVGTGRLVISGPTVAIGTLDGQRFGGRYVSNDIGVIDDRGAVRVLGRADDVVITGGENVHPLEVEEALRSCGATGAVVWGVDDEEWGRSLVGAVTVGEGDDVDSIMEKMRGSVAPHRVPKRLWLVEEFPLLGNEKVDRRAVREDHLPFL
jgi:o-succinylbenzoate---CoA ligase